MAIGVGSVELTNCFAGVGEGIVGYEGGAGGATGTIKAEGQGKNMADTDEEALFVMVRRVVATMDLGTVPLGRLL